MCRFTISTLECGHPQEDHVDTHNCPYFQRTKVACDRDNPNNRDRFTIKTWDRNGVCNRCLQLSREREEDAMRRENERWREQSLKDAKEAEEQLRRGEQELFDKNRREAEKKRLAEKKALEDLHREHEREQQARKREAKRQAEERRQAAEKALAELQREQERDDEMRRLAAEKAFEERQREQEREDEERRQAEIRAREERQREQERLEESRRVAEERERAERLRQQEQEQERARQKKEEERRLAEKKAREERERQQEMEEEQRRLADKKAREQRLREQEAEIEREEQRRLAEIKARAERLREHERELAAIEERTRAIEEKRRLAEQTARDEDLREAERQRAREAERQAKADYDRLVKEQIDRDAKMQKEKTIQDAALRKQQEDADVQRALRSLASPPSPPATPPAVPGPAPSLRPRPTPISPRKEINYSLPAVGDQKIGRFTLGTRAMPIHESQDLPAQPPTPGKLCPSGPSPMVRLGGAISASDVPLVRELKGQTNITPVPTALANVDAGGNGNRPVTGGLRKTTGPRKAPPPVPQRSGVDPKLEAMLAKRRTWEAEEAAKEAAAAASVGTNSEASITPPLSPASTGKNGYGFSSEARRLSQNEFDTKRKTGWKKDFE
ncbi:Smc Chromosome segregation ATPase [Pyrenophora teres f. maculata]|nr:Smc Chromosome segregation ATPase [Pyrenophora teres f. maculata]